MQYRFCIPLLLTIPASADIVTAWNMIALKAIRANNTPPPAAARNLAILHASVYDSVNGITRTHHHYLIPATGPADASIEAAAAAAGRHVLIALYPSLQNDVEVQYQDVIRLLPDTPQTLRGVEWGVAVASAVLQARANDGSANVVSYTPGTQPGQWRPTESFRGVVRPALLAHWGSVRPFALIAGNQFRPLPPPPLNSPEYAADVNSVRDLGAANSTSRTSEQTEIARFWGYGPGSSTPAGHWNEIAQEVVRECDRGPGNHNRRLCGIQENARLFALLNIALADAAIVSWDAKYVFNYWRPITAIQEGEADGNPATRGDPAWAPLLPTPPFPEYTSGHSTFSGAAAVVLAHVFGSDRIRFEVGSDDLPGIRRSYKSFSDAAIESGISRVYGGIHYNTSNIQGLSTGAAVGMFVAWNFLRPVAGNQHGRGPVNRPGGLFPWGVTQPRRARNSPPASVRVRLPASSESAPERVHARHQAGSS